MPASVINVIVCSYYYRSYLCDQRHDYTSDDRPKHTEHRVLVEEPSSNRHVGASTLWMIQIKWSDKQ